MRYPIIQFQELQIKTTSERMSDMPVNEKFLLTLEEASEYFGVGITKLRELSNKEGCEFVLWNGKKRLIKRQKLEKYLEDLYSI